MVNCTLRPFYPRERSPRYPLHMRLSGLQSGSGRYGIEKDLLSLPGIEPQQSNPNSVAIPTRYPGYGLFNKQFIFLTASSFVFVLTNIILVQSVDLVGKESFGEECSVLLIRQVIRNP
jgi:hypothetical protein